MRHTRATADVNAATERYNALADLRREVTYAVSHTEEGSEITVSPADEFELVKIEEALESARRDYRRAAGLHQAMQDAADNALHERILHRRCEWPDRECVCHSPDMPHYS
jgi:hypothetical protein